MGSETLAQSKQGRCRWEGGVSALEDRARRLAFAQPAERLTPEPVSAPRRREPIGAGSNVEHYREQYPGDLLPRRFLGQAALTHRVECRACLFVPLEDRTDGSLEQGVGLGGRSRGQRVVVVHDWHDPDRGPTPQAGLRGGAAPGLLPDMPFERYRGIIPDWNRFTDAVSRPETTTIRVRTGRIEPETLLTRLEGQGYRLVAVDGQPDFFRVEAGSRSIALTLEHWLGLFYVQRASTGLAAPILDPRPGERVLDLCAAPGGKTTHLADLMEDRGPLVAVEPNEARIRALAGNVYRTAHVNVMTVAADGRFFPGGALFDRVLVDAPCSAEGTVRAGKGDVRSRPEAYHDYITRMQEDLLRRAIELTRPGGTVLYSTCTFAPEENEAVVDAVLRDAPVEIEPIVLDVPSAPGLTSFGDLRFDPQLEHAVRIYPHHLDSGGLFLAKLRRTESDGNNSDVDRNRGWSPIPMSFADDASHGRDSERDMRRIDGVRAALSDMWEADSRALDGVDWLLKGDHARVHGCGEWPFEAWAGHRGWKSVSVGLRGFGFDTGDLPRPTNDLLRWLGGSLAGRGVELSSLKWLGLLRREPVRVEGISDGYVALRLSGLTVGRGFVRAGRVRHEIPGVHSGSLRAVLERA